MARKHKAGFMIVEMSMVIGIILALLFIGGMLSVSAVRDWREGKDASLGLQAVYAAQRAYLADHPTLAIAAVSSTDLEEYLPTGWSAMPTAVGLGGETLVLDFNMMPPVFKAGGTPYDPSSKTDDALWDVGE